MRTLTAYPCDGGGVTTRDDDGKLEWWGSSESLTVGVARADARLGTSTELVWTEGSSSR